MAEDDEKREPPSDSPPRDDPSQMVTPPVNAPLDQFNRIARDLRDGAAKGSAPASGPLGQIQSHLPNKPLHKAGRFPADDFLTPYERGLEALKARLSEPIPDELRERIDVQRTKLIENIHHVRNTRDTDTLYDQRHLTLAELNRCLMEAFGVMFVELCDGAQSGGQDPSDDRRAPPANARDVSAWYLGLGPRQQCFALAVMVLYGAKSHEISSAANELYEAITARALPDVSRKKHKRDGEPDSPSGYEGPTPISIDELLEGTFTMRERRKGAEYVKWQDDAMTARMRDFIARQTTTVGMMFGTRDLLGILEQWATGADEERAWRASISLAHLWWLQDQERLFSLATAWAKSDDPNTWQSAAALLYGGYAAEHAEETKGGETARSVVLDELRQWSDWRSDEELACVAAYAYGVLGHQWPGVSLDGLDHLIDIDSETGTKSAHGLPVAIVAFGMIGYMEIALSGHIRPVLARLSGHARRLAKDYRNDVFSREQSSSQLARAARMNTILFLFLILAATAHSAVEGRKRAPYSIEHSLPAFPAFPGERGQDVLLAGLVAESEDQWRESMSTLCCAAICDGYAETILEVIGQWVRLVDANTPAEASLLTFVRGVVARSRAWDKQRGVSLLQSGSTEFQLGLDRWTWTTFEEQAPLKRFAERLRTLS